MPRKLTKATNKETAFNLEERRAFNQIGKMPYINQSLEQQIEVTYAKIQSLPDNYARNQYLMSVYDKNTVLYYAVISSYLEELLPIIYTPTIADAVTNFSRDYSSGHEALFLDTDHPELIEEALTNASQDIEELDAMVITDGEGVLGIGDWGIGGLMISVGKLAVYTAAAGLNPNRVLPVIIDNGTNRQELLDDPHYIGKKSLRKTGQAYLDYIDSFVEITRKKFPNVLFHWEDFGRGNASVILDKYKDKITTFNDDIQGTGIMMAAASYAVATVTKTPLKNHTFLIFGGGTAGIGISDQLRQEVILSGVSEADSYKHFFVVDHNGLITENMNDLTDGQRRYARFEEKYQKLVDLVDIIRAVKPTILIGCSGQGGAFTEAAVKEMVKYTDRPAIMPISNPTILSEATASDLIHWTQGKALVVTGSPSAPVNYNDVSYVIGQANNALMYPGLGLGIVASKASHVTKNMLSKAAASISTLLKLENLGSPILPPLKYAREASDLVAEAVVKAAVEDKVATKQINAVKLAISEVKWEAKYQI
ncbi:MAG: NAD-dependent malic enzyme [Streptococcaceae bacterium]|jgi:malate dehydrogenase (oxaloacetate-decarboxylating)|nr:NAD-dependent malic enzyme [Streptococcaceae bacterium]